MTDYERETIINFNEGEPTASVFTYNKALQNRLEKLLGPDCVKVKEGPGYAEYEVPKKWCQVRPPRRITLTEEQRQAKAERFRASLGLKPRPVIESEDQTTAQT